MSGRAEPDRESDEFGRRKMQFHRRIAAICRTHFLSLNIIGCMDVMDSGKYYLDGMAIHETPEDVLKLFSELNEMGSTIVMITHELNVARSARRIVKIVDGRLYE